MKTSGLGLNTWRGLRMRFPKTHIGEVCWRDIPIAALRFSDYGISAFCSLSCFASDTATRSSTETRTELYETLCSHSSNYSPKRIPQDLSAWGQWSDTLM